MEELIERISDIIISPVICRDIWQFLHRQKRIICLACFIILTFVSPLSGAQKEKISRFDFVNYVYGQLFGLQPSAEEIKRLGILDSFPDGEFHLDWPITRGIAAESFYRISVQLASEIKIPRAFADIPNDSPFAMALSVVGGGFIPRNMGRFEPDKLLVENHLKHAFSVLESKKVLSKDIGKKIDFITVYEPLKNEYDLIESISPELGFSDKPGTNFDYINETLYKIGTINDMSIATQQMNPQNISDIRNAAKEMEEVQKLFKKFGGSILDLTSIESVLPNDEKILRNALSQFNNMLRDFIIRFEYCKEQLSRVTLVDPELIKKCDILNTEIIESLKQIRILRKRINERLERTLPN